MKQKRIFYTEWAYVFGLIFLGLGTALMEKANLGMSMIVAPAYVLYLRISQNLSFFTFGMAEYVFQALLLILLTLIMKKFKWSYLFSFVTAVIYGNILDLIMTLVSVIEVSGMVSRIISFAVGMIFCALGVAFMFLTYISAEAYEQFVKEISEKIQVPISKTKTVYDCISCGVGILLSFIFFGIGHFEGVKVGTILCALVNGFLIGQCSKGLEYIFAFKDRLALRSFFEK